MSFDKARRKLQPLLQKHVPASYPPKSLFRRTRAVPGWSHERDQRRLEGMLNPEVTVPRWMATKELQLARAKYWDAYDRAKNGTALAFGPEDVGREVSRTRRSVDGHRVHFLKRGAGKGTVASVVAEEGGLVRLDDGTEFENPLRGKRKTPPFKYVDQQTPEKPAWSDSRDGARLRGETEGRSVGTKSLYTAMTKRRGEGGTLEERAEATGVPLDILEEVHRRGMGAWSTGHRPGASRTAWGIARVDSFLNLGCTAFTADRKLADAAVRRMDDPSAWTGRRVTCPPMKLRKEYYRKALERMRGEPFHTAVCEGRDDPLVC